MQYRQLESSYKYDVLAEALYGREIEHFHYSLDAQNFEFLISRLPEGDYKEDIKKRLQESLAQMANIELIVEALLLQIDDENAFKDALDRAAIKRREKKE